MDNELRLAKKLLQFRVNLAKAKKLARRQGIRGSFFCPSCRQEQARSGAHCDGLGGPSICENCLLDALVLKHHGKIQFIHQMIPQSEC